MEWIAITVPGLAIRASQLADHLAHLLVVQDGDADDVGRRDVGDAVGRLRARLGERRHRLGAHVEHRSAHRASPTSRMAIGAPMLPRPM